jgi:hypothetical protein
MMKLSNAVPVLLAGLLSACVADAPGYTELRPGTKQQAFNNQRDNVSPVATALAYGEAMHGTAYGWWFGGPLPEGEPMFTASGPAPDPADVWSVNCSGLTNLLLRSIGSEPVGGTAAYYAYYYDVSEWFDRAAAYPPGTLLIRDYYDVYDQGHVAVVDGTGMVLQSFANCYGCTDPGVNNWYTVAESNAYDGWSDFYQLAVRPENWLGATAGCPSGDGNYCGGNGVDGDSNTLYACSGGALTVVEKCALGCQYNTSGTNDVCNASCPFGDGYYCGGNGISGDANTLYKCSDGAVTVSEQCTTCAAQGAGYDDYCE